MVKKLYIEHLGISVTLTRRVGTRSIRISLRNDGTIKISVPYGVSDRSAEKFLISKAEWIKEHAKVRPNLVDGQHIGKSHRLVLLRSDVEAIKTRVGKNEVTVTLPLDISADSDEAQHKIQSTAERALKKEAESLLPQRLEFLANKYDIEYGQVSVKKLKSRWGSCDSRKNIVLNIYLMQLDWSLIDYVIVHELAHTHHQHHQKPFWDFLETMLPDYKQRKKLIKDKPTNIVGTNY
ncbi:MAG: putative metal-dependent hydrolase [Candidatus Saccharimonadales bacterium]|jgi:predicted metal-dependent hydrolase